MAVTYDSNEGAQTSTTEATMVDSPSSGTKRVVTSMYVHNIDGAPITFLVYKDVSATNRQLYEVTLQDTETWEWDGRITLDDTKKIEIDLALAAVAGGVVWSVDYFDRS